jgi:hypothetical protein
MQKEDLERMARYIGRNPFSVEKMSYRGGMREGVEGKVIYRTGNESAGAMAQRSRNRPGTYRRKNFEVFSETDFIAAITQHIPDKSFQLVRYYGWYSNKMRGQRLKKEAGEQSEPCTAVRVIDVSEYQPRRIPSAKWRELIKKVWEADPLECPNCGHEMRIVALIDEGAVVDLPAMLRIALQAGKILRHLGLLGRRSPCGGGWQEGGGRARSTGSGRVRAGPGPPVERICEPVLEDPFPDYDTDPVTCPPKPWRRRMDYECA